MPQWLRAYEPAPDGQGGKSANVNQPEGVLFPITPDLIRLQRAQPATDVGQDVKRLFGVARPYTIGPGDLLNIVVWDHPELSLAPAGDVGSGHNVSADGLIQFPFIGRIKLGGLTESQARDELVAKLGKYIKNPEITVRIQAYRSGRVYVEGEVRQTGPQAVNDIPLTLPEAISRAGGFSAAADRSTVAITREGNTTLINLPQLAKLGVNPGNILLAGGDTVQVPHRDEAKVFVLGEVLKPLALPLRNGRMTLNEALGESGGVSQVSGDPRQIFVLRNGAAGNAEIYHLDARTPAAYALAEGFDLKARDVVFVDPAPLVRWNRVLSLLLPSAQIGNVARDVIK
ncbi:polysaccharide biosynthesis/export family protein [Polaromonas sp.]|uniref:polysaccharide biosynthesis/export family protein n=1 Tax=Polaromonas sp. TaxID=1869339 RepID=UPI00286C4EE4|nr:polysaccharide biosynthesis/export family protein [Polaromonas sp.]